MADNNEEEYLDSLLKSMVDNIDETAASQDGLSVEEASVEEYDSSEDDDMAMLSRMLLEENDISFDDIIDDAPEEAQEEPTQEEPVLEDDDIFATSFGDYMSLDDLLNEATNNESGDIEIPEGLFSEAEITPIMNENNGGGYEDASMDEEPEIDFFADFNEIDSVATNETTAVNENVVRESVYSMHKDDGVSFDSDLEKELADILSLDEGMSLDDIPDISEEQSLTEAELDKISDIEEAHAAEETAVTIEPEEETEKQVYKKEKKTKKPKKEKKPKPKKEKKEKKKFSFKEFISKFNDDEDDKKSADNNQALIDELYKDTKSLDDVDPTDEKSSKKKGKKAKKAKADKPKKPKKVKTPKEKKEPVATPESEKVQIGNAGVAIIFLLVLVFLFGGYFGVQFINYKLTIREAKNLYELGNYGLAYDEISGLDIKSGDEKFYNQVRAVMVVYQGYESYNNYITLDKEPEALDALINAVGRKQLVEEQALKYDVTDRVNDVYDQILSILEFYGIDESEALDLYRMEDFDEYYEMLESFEGVAE